MTKPDLLQRMNTQLSPQQQQQHFFVCQTDMTELNEEYRKWQEPKTTVLDVNAEQIVSAEKK